MAIRKFDEEAGRKVLQFFSSLADETRLKIILSLVDGPRNVGEIHNYVGKNKMTLSAISHQLKQLSDLEIVKFEKFGKEKRFRLSNNLCWCILKDTFKQFNKNIKIKCEKCKNNGEG